MKHETEERWWALPCILTRGRVEKALRRVEVGSVSCSDARRVVCVEKVGSISHVDVRLLRWGQKGGCVEVGSVSCPVIVRGST